MELSRFGARLLCACGAAVVLSAGACDDAARVAVRSRTAVDDAARYADDAARAAREAGSEAAARRIDEAAAVVRADDDETRKAVAALTWDTACDLVAGAGPTGTADLPTYLAERAASFGFEFLGDAEQALAEALMATLDTRTEEDDVAAACDRLATMAP